MTQMNLKDLPEEAQFLILTHASAFSMACGVLEQVTGIPSSMWANKIATESLLSVNSMSKSKIEKILEAMNKTTPGVEIIDLTEIDENHGTHQ
jgi:hypothetical protein